MTRRGLKTGCIAVVALVLVSVMGIAALLVWQGRWQPVGEPGYVALGSSFAAGIGLGPRVANSPLVCQRSANGYPAQLARTLHLPLLDMTCSGATTQNVLHGGQVFQGPQIAPISEGTRLVTLTTGGNDVGYVSDLSLMAARGDNGIGGWAARNLWDGPKAMAKRDFAGMRVNLEATIREIMRRAPAGIVVVVTYPKLLPAQGTCARLQLDAGQVADMRAVGERLAAETRAAAQATGAVLVDAHALGALHDACSANPWVNGWRDPQGTPFHPTAAGARAVSQMIAQTLRSADPPKHLWTGVQKGPR